ncbi:MAG: nucleotidyltransferase substrate binding protein [Nitrospinota bacterium]|nr:nucleotidyltransferase substrate binding protein [Nitrospinota bacterium]
MKPEDSTKILLTHFDWNLQRMSESLQNEKTDYYRDAALQRFGHTFDLSVKCIQAFAENMDTPCQSARECFEIAVKNNWVSKDDNWEDVLQSYDNVKQRLKGEPAEEVYNKLERFHISFKNMYENLSEMGS